MSKEVIKLTDLRNDPMINQWAKELVENYIRKTKEEKSLEKEGLKKEWYENLSFKDVKKNIIFRLSGIREKKNEEIIYAPIADLRALIYLMLEFKDRQIQLIPFTFSMAEYWNETSSTLFETAVANSRRIMPARTRMIETVLGMSRLPGSPVMKVVTNECGFFGASAMLYPDVLKNLADDFNDDILFLPSSIYEVIAMPYKIAESFESAEDISYIIRLINSSLLKSEEVLSNHPYVYERESKNFCSA